VSVRDDFSPGGALDLSLDGYEPREQQIDMAEAVAHALDHNEKLLVEAGTGTGKTLAYLLPAVRSKRRVMVSTATKTLQHQLLEKDIPLLQQIVGPVDAVLLKGRQNYLCVSQFERFAEDPQLRNAEEEILWPQLREWAEGTATGDRAELHDFHEEMPLWQRVTSTADQCAGRDCPDFSKCFLFNARERAASADIVIVNHHLFFADAAVQDRRDMRLLPEVEALIFDEGHHLEETASAFFTIHVSNRSLDRILEDLEDQLLRGQQVLDVSAGVRSNQELEDRLKFVREEGDAFFAALRALAEGHEGRAASASSSGGLRMRQNRLPLRAQQDDQETRIELHALLSKEHPDAAEQIEALQEQAFSLDEAMKALRLTLQKLYAEPSARLRERLSTWAEDLLHILRHEADSHIYLLTLRMRTLSLEAIPLDVRPIFWRHVFGHRGATVVTSATLATDGNLRFLRQRLGAPKETVERTLESPFDYMKQALLYVPQNIPAPNDPRFVEAMAEEVYRLVETTQGRAFVLFTSYRNMHYAHQILSKRWRWKTLMQGEMSRARLLELFREDGHAVLFATASFWEGVDVPGDALSLVIMDKLPFANPNDPLVSARNRDVERGGGKAFRDYTVPQAIIRLKQGFGRLIRTKSDVGIVAIMDTRLVEKSYGSRIVQSLPRARRTRDAELTKRWWAHVSQQGDSTSLE